MILPKRVSLAMIKFLAALMVLAFPGGSVLAFVVPTHVKAMKRRTTMDQYTPNKVTPRQCTHTWSPQDLTMDALGFLPIPDDDYVKEYQRNPELWPVEFFLIAYRRINTKETGGKETQILVRKSANGTSKWGVGTGVPATRWMLSASPPPRGYQLSEPPITVEATSFPEFPNNVGQQSWTYQKIDICKDAFDEPDLHDLELEEYAKSIRNELRGKLSETKRNGNENLNLWESTRIDVVKNVVDSANSLAAIQGTLRMSGLFARKKTQHSSMETIDTHGSSSSARYVSLGENAPDPAKLVQSMRIYTMFPQMPDPMPLPLTPPEELRKEIATRKSRMAKSGRDPHKDKYGRKFTHKSTSNVSNTIHGVYFTLDATDLPGLDEVPALDLVGTKETAREWKSLVDLKVLDADGKHICTQDPKPTFISGFIVRQLVKEGVINIDA